MVLFQTPRFVDESFEDSAHRFAIERCWRARSQVLEEPALALRIVNPETMASLVLSDLQHDLYAAGHELEDLVIDVVDLTPELCEFWV